MDDRDLSNLFHEAVSDVEPTDRLAEIRRATQPTPRRSGWYAAGGTLLAVAAAVTAFSVVTSPDERADDLGPGTPAASTTSSDPGLGLQAVYFVGDTSVGPRLFREFHEVRGGPSPQAALAALGRPAYDPDYGTYFPMPYIGAVEVRDGVIDVTLQGSSVRDAPEGMTPAAAELGVQQLVYTLQAGAGAPLPVQFRLGKNPIDAVLGVPTSEPIAKAPQLDVLSLVSISDPVEGLQVDDSFIADGAASSFEGNVPWELRAPDGDVVRSGAATAGAETKLVEWTTGPIDVSDLEPGRYTFVATTDDEAFTDTRTVVVL